MNSIKEDENDEGIELLKDITDIQDVESMIDEDAVLIDKLNSITMWNDICHSLWIGKYFIVIGGLIGFGIAFYMTIWKYKVASVENINTLHTWESLSLIRPVLNKEKKLEVYSNVLYGETSLQLPNNEAISFRYHDRVDKYGSQQLPELFYHGVMFSIGLGNSHGVPYSSVSPNPNASDDQHRQLADMHSLFESISDLKPKPVYIAPRTIRNNNTKWSEHGYMLYYSYKQLEEHGLLSNADPLQPWRRVSESILTIARQYKQFYITVYYANAFGPSSTNQMHKIIENNNKFKRKLAEDGNLKSYETMRKQKEKPVPYRLHQSYDGSYTTESVLPSSINDIEDEVKYYKSRYPSGPQRSQEHLQQIAERERRRKLKATMSNVHQPHSGESIIEAVTKAARDVREKQKQEKHKHHGLKDIHDHKYENIIQMVIPTHTGLDEIKSAAVMWLSKYEHQKPSEIALKTFETKTGRRLTTEESSTNQHDNIEPMQTPIYLHAAPRQFIHFKSNEVLELPFKPLDRLVDTTTASHTEQETKDELPSKRQLSEEGMEVDYYNFVFGYHENFLDKIDEIDTVYRKPWN